MMELCYFSSLQTVVGRLCAGYPLGYPVSRLQRIMYPVSYPLKRFDPAFCPTYCAPTLMTKRYTETGMHNQFSLNERFSDDLWGVILNIFLNEKPQNLHFFF